MTTGAADYSRWGRYASADVDAVAPARSPWGADASADLDVDDEVSAGRDGLWGEGESADEFGYADDVEEADVEEADVEEADVEEGEAEAGGAVESAAGVMSAEPADDVEAFEAADDIAAAEEVVAADDVEAVAGFASTGHEAVDAAVRAVENAARLPVGEQLAAYEAAHTTLREVLASIEE